MIGELTGLSQEFAGIYFVQVEEMVPLCGTDDGDASPRAGEAACGRGRVRSKTRPYVTAAWSNAAVRRRV
jgi:hypothetical protein